MKNISITVILMVFLSFSLLIVPVVSADWWERGDRPIYPRESVFPTTEPTVAPTNAPIPSVTPDPGDNNDNNNDDPCAPGKSYTGDYCGWSPRVGGTDSGSSDSNSGGESPQVLGLSYTDKDTPGLSDIMLLLGILCLLLYGKSKFAPNVNLRMLGKRKSR